MTFSDHVPHGRWERTGRCVYCPCGMRLYQGEAPKDDQEQLVMGEVMDSLFEAARKKMRRDEPPGAPQ